jgi:tetratricopeptide (TPR) repeat protein
LISIALTFALGMQAAVQGPPYYERPASPAADLTLFQQQHDLGSANEQWWLRRVALYTDMGELDQISDLVDTLARAWPGQPVFREARMILENGRGQHKLALQLGTSILADFPNYASIRVNLARVYLANGDTVSALNMMIAAIEAGPVRIKDWEFLLRTMARGDRSAARTLERLESKVKANPNLRGLKFLQVALYTRFGQYAKARDILVANPELASHPELQKFIETVDATATHESAALAATKKASP